MLDETNPLMTLFMGAVTDLLDARADDAVPGAAAFSRDEVVGLMADAIDQMDAGGRAELARAVFDLCAAQVWPPAG